jgi:hypothetical protein
MILRVAISLYLTGLLMFYSFAAFEITYWSWLYYGWDKLFGCSALLWYVVLIHTKEKHLVKPVFVFSIIRFLWEIMSYFTGVTVSNEIAIAVLFILLIAVCLYLFIKDLKWLKARR